MVHDEVRRDQCADTPTPTARADQAVDPPPTAGDVTRILSQIAQGDGQAAEQLLPLVYEELRKLAAAKMAQEKPGQTLQATALVHEAYVRLVDCDTAKRWDSRGHFFAAAAEAMRRILVEQARRKAGPDAGGGHRRLDISQVEPEVNDPRAAVRDSQ